MKRPPGVTPPPPGSERKPPAQPPKPAEPTEAAEPPRRAASPKPSGSRKPAEPREPLEETAPQLPVAFERSRLSASAPWWTRKRAEAEGSATRDPANRQPTEQLTEPLPFVKPAKTPSSHAQTAPVEPHRPKEPDARQNLKEAEKQRRRYERSEARRFTQRSRTRRRNVLIGAGVVVVVVLLAVLTAYSPLLTLKTITVEGASRVDGAAVSSALDDQLGRPLPLIDFGEVQKELTAFPLIQSYVTESRPPDTLVVRIVERRPVASVATASGFDLVDPVGVVIQQSADRPAGFPTVETTTTKVGSPGFAAAGKMLAAVPADFFNQIDVVGAATPDSVTLLLTGGQHVVWGSADDSPLKARILTALLAQPDLDTDVIDVSSPEAPVVGP